MPGGGTPALTASERSELERWARSRATPYRLILRARIVLAAADGQSQRRIAERLGVNPVTVRRWISRFDALRLEGIARDAPRPGRPKQLSAELEERIVEATRYRKPSGRRHWTARLLAREFGVSHTTIHRVWRKHHLRPHAPRIHRLQADARYLPLALDIVGAFVRPPIRILALTQEGNGTSSTARSSGRLMSGSVAAPVSRPGGRYGVDQLLRGVHALAAIGTVGRVDRFTRAELKAFLEAVGRRARDGDRVFIIADGPEDLSAHVVNEWTHTDPRFAPAVQAGADGWDRTVESWIHQAADRRLQDGSLVSADDFAQAIRLQADRSPGATSLVWVREPKNGRTVHGTDRMPE